MNIFKQLNKLPQTDINDVSYGSKRVSNDHWYARRSFKNKVVDGKTLSEWAEYYDVNYRSVLDIFRKTGTPHHTYKKKFEGKTYSQWATELGVTYACIHCRMQRYGNPYPRISDWKKKFEGKTYSQWATELQVTVDVIYNRMRKSGNPFFRGDRNYIGPGYKGQKYPSYQGKSVKEWAEKLGVAENYIKTRLRTYGHPYNKTTCRQMNLKIDRTDK